MKVISRILVILAIIISTACTRSNERKFVGCYALENGGRAELKISNDGGKYFFSLRESGGWSKPEGLHLGSIKEIQQLFGKDSVRIKANLVADKGPLAIFLVSPGELYGGEKAKTEYIALLGLGGGSVYKVPCK